jgi:hypothetical protein
MERERERDKESSTFLQASKDGTMEFVDGGKEDSVIQEILEELSFVTQGPSGPLGPSGETNGIEENERGEKEKEREEDEDEEREREREDDEDNREPIFSFSFSSLSSIFSSIQLKMSFFCAFACLCALYITIPAQIQPYLIRIPDQITRSGIAWIIFFIVSHLL